MAIDFSAINTSTGYSGLFGSLNTSSSSGTSDSSASLFTDWASLKNGTTAKLAKAYYGNAATKSDTKQAAELARETVKANNTVKSDATDLKNTTSALADSKSLFTIKVDAKDKDGNVVRDDSGNAVKDYDRAKITQNLKDFVSSYNAVVQSGGDSDNKSVLRNTMYMTQMTTANKDLLADVGITIGEDNKLSIDEEKANTADINDLSSLFSGHGSYAASVGSRASEIINAVNVENNRLSQYSSSGSYVSADTLGKLYSGTV